MLRTTAAARSSLAKPRALSRAASSAQAAATAAARCVAPATVTVSQTARFHFSSRVVPSLTQRLNARYEAMQLRSYASGSFPSHSIINMPALSPTMTQGNLGKWHKKVGDQINQGDILVEIETDKAQMDFECQEEGYLAQILVPAGEKDLAVNKPIAVLVEDKNDVAAFEKFTLADVQGAAPAPAAAAPAASAPQAAAPAAAAAAAPASAPAGASEGRIFASPLARNLAAERGIPLQTVSGSGPNGRIVKADIDSYKAPVAVAAPAVPAFAPTTAAGAAFVDIPLTNVRKVIATRLTQSKQTLPHYYLSVEVSVDKILKLREVLNSQGNGAYKLSVNDFVIKASSLALRDVPEVNSSWQDTFIRQFSTSDIAVAVATENGLITPIVAGAEGKGLAAISNKVKELAARAKENKLQPQEYQGGTFTISNLGMFGISNFTAIINPPHAAILAVGTTQQKLVLDESAEKGFSVQNTMTVTLSCDHRVVDGAVGAKWLAKFKSYIEDPLTILL
ncbi:2-oxoacid dehydrogenases acyltransferase-domain-containing protein [Polychytrium aggregatum]|uniref:2-oxoacid dehydrogenases acyltransferase-domain-containing protein n=1 Tax=Polychytrium aggregatum TaxID=110093 RepID=UPI0022FF3F13|nr:2-oxoacid dehydrogenases acyltransferase-domain-containing protein [Polychytrium aggregatum]KAI9207485.1 2-oxoacid dehydrogenases acyltransferase-domain-containing protein [Polychytrium aggregatum]